MTLRSVPTGEGATIQTSVAFLPTNSANAQSIGAEDELSPTLAKGGGESGNKPSVAIGFKYKQGEKSQKPFAENGESQALSSGCHDSAVAIGFKAGQSKDGGLGDEREVSPTLSHKPSALEPTVAQSTFVRIGSMTRRDRPTPPSEEVAHALTKTDGDAGDNAASVIQSLAAMRYIVRRLTPTECERLMGLPDGYTIPAGLDANDPALVAEFQRIHDTFGAIMAEYEHAKPPKPKTAAQVQKWLAKITGPATCPDSPRYKGCGNGWATNQPRWILTRLLNAEGIEW